MEPHKSSWRPIVEKYEQPSRYSGIWQIVNSIGPYVLIWYLMTLTVHVSYPLTIALSFLAAGFWIRVFIISHDCGHGSFFKSKRANHFWGMVAGTITCTPYLHWRREHAKHHGSSGNLDRRGSGDIWTLTVDEYLASPFLRRVKYRLYRNPILMFGFGAFLLFAYHYRIAKRIRSGILRRSVYWTNACLLLIFLAMSAWVGFTTYMMILLPVMFIACGSGVWLFYVQHQFEGVYWERDDDWDYLTQAMEGSSFYKLPRILQWFTGNIGFHHIHHLSHRIPNYLLAKCHYENKIFQQVPEITLVRSLKSLTFRLWDEDSRKLISFGDLRRATKAAA